MAFFWCLFSLVLNSAFVHCASIAVPRNTAIVAGQRMEMKCRNDTEYSFRSWLTHRVSDELEKQIFQYDGQASRVPQFGIERENPGFVTLYSNSTASSDAGVYRCTSLESSTSDLVTFSAQLIVFESYPECETILSGEVIEKGSAISIRCNVRFKGNMSPEIEWRQTEHDASSGGQLVAHDVMNVDSGHIVSTLKIVVDFPRLRIYTFKTFFLPPSASSRPNDNPAVNAPDYKYVWISDPIGLPSAFSPTSVMAASSLAVKSSPPDDNDVVGESVGASYLTASSTGATESSKHSFLFEQWMLISVCVGVAVVASVVVAALISYSRCIRAKIQADEQQVNRISMSQFGNYVEMQTSADTYCSIGDEIVRNENATVPQQMLAQRSLSSPDHVRNLPRPPPAQPVENPSYDIQPLCYEDRPSQKQRTTTLNHARQRDRCASGSALTLPLSSSLPTIYQIDSSLPEKSVNRTRGPVQNGHTDPETEPYLAAQDVPVDELGTIPSTYLRVNKLSERNF